MKNNLNHLDNTVASQSSFQAFKAMTKGKLATVLLALGIIGGVSATVIVNSTDSEDQKNTTSIQSPTNQENTQTDKETTSNILVEDNQKETIAEEQVGGPAGDPEIESSTDPLADLDILVDKATKEADKATKEADKATKEAEEAAHVANIFKKS